jgi:hypothetical protein
MPWFAVPPFDESRPHIELLLPSDQYTGWEAFAIGDVLLTLAAVGTLLGLGLALVLSARWPFLGIAAVGWLAIAGGALWTGLARPD